MGKFLYGEQLSKKIKGISEGENKRFAVAFWGDGAFDFLFPKGSGKGAKVICDLSMGATNPAEIEKLQKSGAEVRHIASFHGKVYLSSNGVVVASANASRNGLGFEGEAKHVETGVFHGANSWIYGDADIWFDEIWDRAEVVTDKALKDAQTEWNRRSFAREAAHPSKDSIKGKTLLWVLEYRPDVFGDIQFVITSSSVDKTVRKRGEAELKKQFESDVGGSESKPLPTAYEVFSDFKLETSEWPERFISISLGSRGKPYIKLCTVGDTVFVEDSEGKEVDFHRAYVRQANSDFFADVSNLWITEKHAVDEIREKPIFAKFKELSDEDAAYFSAQQLHKILFKNHPPS